MKQIFNVFTFTYKVNARKKAFIITTVIMLAAVLILCSLPRLLLAFTGGDIDRITGGFYTCYFVDETGKFNGGELELAKELPDTKFMLAEKDQVEELKGQIKKDATLSLIHITVGEDQKPEISIIAKDFLNGVASKSANVNDILNRVYSVYVLTEQNISPDVIADAQTELNCRLETEGGLTLSGYAIGILLITLTFFAVYYYGYGVAASVASEKSSRIMETLIVSAKPSKILIGKCLGMGMLGLTQFGGVILFAVICWTLLIPADFTVMGETLSLSAFTPKSALLILVFFVLGYILYAFMNAVCGAVVDKIEDLNSAMMPVMILSMGAFYLSYFTAIMGTTYDYLINLSMYIPFSAPFIMPFVLINGEVGTPQILLSLGILIATIIVVVMISMRVYTASVMHYGKRVKLKDAIKSKRG